MTKIIDKLSLGLCLLTAVACSKNESATFQEFSVHGTVLATKSPQLDNNGAGMFAIGDEISLFFKSSEKEESCKYTFGSKKFWSDLGFSPETGEIYVSAAYPAVTAENPKDFKWDCSKDNGTTDFLTGSKVKATPFSTKAIDIAFSHILHKISVSLEPYGDNISDEDLKTARISCKNALSTASINLLESEVSASGAKYEFNASGKNVSFIIPPQPAGEITVCISVGERNFSFSLAECKIEGKPIEKLNSGQTLSLKIKVSKSAFILSGQNIGGWTEQGEINGDIII